MCQRRDHASSTFSPHLICASQWIRFGFFKRPEYVKGDSHITPEILDGWIDPGGREAQEMWDSSAWGLEELKLLKEKWELAMEGWEKVTRSSQCFSAFQ